MPAGPMMKCRLAANSTATSTSVSSTTAYGNCAATPGHTATAASAASPMATAARLARVGGCNGGSCRPPPRATGCGLPSKPQGRATSTTAITTNSTTSVSFENDRLTPITSTNPSQMHTALSSAISSAATKAPDIEPMPPTTTTTKAAPMRFRSMSRLALSRGNCSAPPSPASSEPSANTAVNSHAWLTPSALTISRSCAQARTSVPQRVRLSSSHSAPSTSGPAAIKNKS